MDHMISRYSLHVTMQSFSVKGCRALWEACCFRTYVLPCNPFSSQHPHYDNTSSTRGCEVLQSILAALWDLTLNPLGFQYTPIIDS